MLDVNLEQRIFFFSIVWHRMYMNLQRLTHCRLQVLCYGRFLNRLKRFFNIISWVFFAMSASRAIRIKKALNLEQHIFLQIKGMPPVSIHTTCFHTFIQKLFCYVKIHVGILCKTEMIKKVKMPLTEIKKTQC